MTFVAAARRAVPTAAVLVALGVAAFRPTEDEAASSDPPGLFLMSDTAADPAACAGAVAVLARAEAPVYVVDADGLPVVSSAGYVRVRAEGPGFFYANTAPERAARARRRGEIDADNWGDVEAFRVVARVLRRLRTEDPAAPSLGIEDVSAAAAGFPDFDGDGVSDHVTHQLGCNVNFLLASREGPRRLVHLGLRNEDAYDARTTRRLVRALRAEGARGLTTSSGAGFFDPEDPIGRDFAPASVATPGVSAFVAPDGFGVTLMNDVKSHGDVLNVLAPPVL